MPPTICARARNIPEMSIPKMSNLSKNVENYDKSELSYSQNVEKRYFEQKCLFTPKLLENIF